MKLFIILSVVIAGISCFPRLDTQVLADTKNPRFINELIINAIEQLKQDIVNEGYDPFFVEYHSESYALPVPVIFNAQGFVEDFLLKGLSNIDIIHIDYTVLSSRLEFDLFMPLLDATFRHAEGRVEIFGTEYKAVASGSLSISNIRIAGDLNVSILSGISLTRLALDCSVGSIKSDLNVVLLGHDVSNDLNHFLEVTVVETLDEFKGPVNELISYYAIDIINDILADVE